MDAAFVTLALLVALALAFDFMNGFHDAANSIATVVSTGVLKPYQAVAWAAFFNFVAICAVRAEGGRHRRQGHRRPGLRRPLRDLRRAGRRDHLEHRHLVLRHSVEFVACADRRHDRRRRSRRRASDALVGSGIIKTAIFILVSPLLGFVLGALMLVDQSWVCFRIAPPRRMDRWFRRLQLLVARSTASGTAATTRRRPWASSGCC
jgi:PiT family inorganic phosphate transporter